MRNTWLGFVGMAALMMAAGCVVHARGSGAAQGDGQAAGGAAPAAPAATAPATPAATPATPAATTPPATEQPGKTGSRIRIPGGRHPVTASGACPNIAGNGKIVKLAEGTCQGDLIISGNGNQVVGAGVGKSVVAGGLLLSGNQNQLHGVTVNGPSAISGNENDATANELVGQVVVTGNANKR